MPRYFYIPSDISAKFQPEKIHAIIESHTNYTIIILGRIRIHLEIMFRSLYQMYACV